MTLLNFLLSKQEPICALWLIEERRSVLLDLLQVIPGCLVHVFNLNVCLTAWWQQQNEDTPPSKKPRGGGWCRAVLKSDPLGFTA